MSGSTRALRKLRAQVLREEPLCWLQLPGCTHIADTLDHVLPRADRPDLVLMRANCRGACANCNRARGRLPVSVLPQRGRAPALAFFD